MWAMLKENYVIPYGSAMLMRGKSLTCRTGALKNLAV